MTSKLALHVFDVGQGASAVLDFGDDRYGIVDCGGTSSRAQAGIVSFLRKAYSSNPGMRVLFLLVTHLDMDHVRAVVDLFEEVEITKRIERIYCNDLAYRTLLSAVRTVAKKRRSGIGSNLPSVNTLRALRYIADLIHRRSDIDLDFHGECLAPETSQLDRYPVPLRIPSLGPEFEINIWSPSQRLRDQGLERISMPPNELLAAVLAGHEIEDWNAASVVMTISFDSRQILIAGDATHRTWEEIFQRAGSGWDGADVVVAWHHGGKLGSTNGKNHDAIVWPRVLSRSGKIVCISAGHGNRYGHPHPETLAAIRSQTGQVYCTQRTKQDVPVGSHIPGENTTGSFLRLRSKSGLRLESNSENCCGQISVEIEQSSELRVTCSSRACTDRSMHHDCCCCPQLAFSHPA